MARRGIHGAVHGASTFLCKSPFIPRLFLPAFVWAQVVRQGSTGVEVPPPLRGRDREGGTAGLRGGVRSSTRVGPTRFNRPLALSPMGPVALIDPPP